MFDVWTGGATHYAAIYACFTVYNSPLYEYFMSGLGPYEDEIMFGSNELYKYTSFTLSIYGKMVQCRMPGRRQMHCQ